LFDFDGRVFVQCFHILRIFKTTIKTSLVFWGDNSDDGPQGKSEFDSLQDTTTMDLENMYELYYWFV